MGFTMEKLKPDNDHVAHTTECSVCLFTGWGNGLIKAGIHTGGRGN